MLSDGSDSYIMPSTSGWEADSAEGTQKYTYLHVRHEVVVLPGQVAAHEVAQRARKLHTCAPAAAGRT